MLLYSKSTIVVLQQQKSIRGEKMSSKQKPDAMLDRIGPNSKGFTLVEIIVILAVISILVAILTPTVLKYIDEARGDRAGADVKNINAMINDLIKDTGQYPGAKLESGNTFLCGPGTVGQAGWGSSTTCED